MSKYISVKLTVLMFTCLSMAGCLGNNPMTSNPNNKVMVCQKDFYDTKGNLITKNLYDENGNLILCTKSMYDTKGNMIVRNLYDENGQIIKENFYDRSGTPLNNRTPDNTGTAKLPAGGGSGGGGGMCVLM